MERWLHSNTMTTHRDRLSSYRKRPQIAISENLASRPVCIRFAEPGSSIQHSIYPEPGER